MRSGRTVLATPLRQVGPAGDVAVLDEVLGLSHAAGTEVDDHHRFDPGLAGPGNEFVCSELVRLQGPPRRLRPLRTHLTGSHTVLPAICRDEVAAGVADECDA